MQTFAIENCLLLWRCSVPVGIILCAVHGRNTDKFKPCVLQVGWYSGCGCLCGLKVAVQCLCSTSSFLFVAIGLRNGEAMKAFMGDSMTVGAIAQNVGLIAVRRPRT